MENVCWISLVQNVNGMAEEVDRLEKEEWPGVEAVSGIELVENVSGLVENVMGLVEEAWQAVEEVWQVVEEV